VVRRTEIKLVVNVRQKLRPVFDEETQNVEDSFLGFAKGGKGSRGPLDLA
jgi:hypothetical protein